MNKYGGVSCKWKISPLSKMGRAFDRRCTEKELRISLKKNSRFSEGKKLTRAWLHERKEDWFISIRHSGVRGGRKKLCWAQQEAWSFQLDFICLRSSLHFCLVLGAQSTCKRSNSGANMPACCAATIESLEALHNDQRMLTICSVARMEMVWNCDTNTAMARSWSAIAALPRAVVERSSKIPNACSAFDFWSSGSSSIRGAVIPAATTRSRFHSNLHKSRSTFKLALIALGYRSSRSIFPNDSNTLGPSSLENWISQSASKIAATIRAAFTFASKLPVQINNANEVATSLPLTREFWISSLSHTGAKAARIARASSAAIVDETLPETVSWSSWFSWFDNKETRAGTPPQSRTHRRLLSPSRTRFRTFWSAGRGSTAWETSCTSVATALGSRKGLGGETLTKEKLCFAHHSSISLRSVWFGTISRVSSCCIVAGHVVLPASSHCSMLALSYVCPVHSVTGSFISSNEIGHLYSIGTTTFSAPGGVIILARGNSERWISGWWCFVHALQTLTELKLISTHTLSSLIHSFNHSIAARSQSTAMTHCKSRQSLTPAAESSGLLARAQWESRQPEDRVSLLLKLRCHDIQSRLPHKFLTASLVLLIPQQQQRRRRPPPRRHHHHNSFSPAPVQKKLHAKHSASFSYSSRQNGSVDPAYPESDHRCHSLLTFLSLYSSLPPSSFPLAPRTLHMHM